MRQTRPVPQYANNISSTNTTERVDTLRQMVHFKFLKEFSHEPHIKAK